MDNTAWVKKYDTADYVYTKDVNQFVVEFCEDLPAGLAIDVAGGEGRNAVWLAKHGWTVEVIDFAPNALAKAAQLASDNQVSDRIVTTEASALDFESQLGSADLVVMAYLHIYSHQFAQAFSHAVTVLKPGGHLMGVWHALENLEHNSHGPQNPDTLPSVGSLTQLCLENNLQILTLENRDGKVRTDDGPKPSVTVVLFAQKPAR